jgi:hypothetical protein
MFECQTSNVNEVTPLILLQSRVIIIDLGECYDAGGTIDNKSATFIADIGALFGDDGQVSDRSYV